MDPSAAAVAAAQSERTRFLFYFNGLPAPRVRRAKVVARTILLKSSHNKLNLLTFPDVDPAAQRQVPRLLPLIRPRQCHKVTDPLAEVLLLCLLAVLAGADGAVDTARFASGSSTCCGGFLPFRDGTPSGAYRRLLGRQSQGAADRFKPDWTRHAKDCNGQSPRSAATTPRRAADRRHHLPGLRHLPQPMTLLEHSEELRVEVRAALTAAAQAAIEHAAAARDQSRR
jgi:hypothetical protein